MDSGVKNSFIVEESVSDEFKDNPVFARKTLEEIERELCLIKLCWPDSEIRHDIYLYSLPVSYYTVNNKERLLLWYADNFRKQYHAIFQDRRPLLMACKNECNVQKFSSISITTFTLSKTTINGYQNCASFISGYVQYESLNQFLILPEYLRSPTWVMNFQRGNSFECSTVLVSLLIGKGYNAYVVSGYASREQVECNLTRTVCPFLPKDERPPTPPKIEHVDRYEFKPPPDFESKFLRLMKEREEKEEEMKLQQQEAEHLKKIQEEEKLPPDPYRGRRVHAWVVILPDPEGPRKNEIVKPIFIESSTGTSYDPLAEETDDIYFGVESIWNNKNYWVNVQSNWKICSKINWDLYDVKCWEHLLPGEMKPKQTNVLSDFEIDIEREKHLDMPFSYVNQIEITGLDFERRYPGGMKVIHYKRCKVELFAPYVQKDGLQQRITLYEDLEYNNEIQIYEEYANRSDKLVKSNKDLIAGSVDEYYERGRSDACKKHSYFLPENNRLETKRIIEFYDIRIDSLLRIETDSLRIIQEFGKRDDLLCYRCLEFFTDEKEGKIDLYNRKISKITEKFNRDLEIPASKDVAVREFSIRENELRLKYHYNDDGITRATKTFKRPAMADRGPNLVFDLSMMKGYNPNPLEPPETKYDLCFLLMKLLTDEEKLMSSITEIESQITAFIKLRTATKLNPTLIISPFDKYRGIEESEMKDEYSSSRIQRSYTDEVDYLQPYLARIGNPTRLSKTEASLLLQECLDDFKQKCIDKANKIMYEFKKCNDLMIQLRNKLVQTENLPMNEKEDTNKKLEELELKLQALNVKLNRHKTNVPKRFERLQQFLQKHPMLSMLNL